MLLHKCCKESMCAEAGAMPQSHVPPSHGLLCLQCRQSGAVLLQGLFKMVDRRCRIGKRYCIKYSMGPA